MYLSRNVIREVEAPKRWILKRQASTVSPVYRKDYSLDNISVHSSDRTSTPQSKSNSSSTRKILRNNGSTSRPITASAKTIESVPWYKTTKGTTIAVSIISAVCIAIVLGTVLAVVLTRNPSVLNSAPTSTVIQSATWTFDGTTNDLYGIYNGTLSTNAAYSATTYFGTGSSLLLNSGLSPPPFVTFASPYFNLSYRSFTVEAWVLLYTITGDNVLLSQCECGGCSSRCLSLPM